MASERMVLRAFHHLVAERLGLVFPEGRHSDFRNALGAALQSQGLRNLEELFDLAEDQPVEGDLWHVLRERLTVGETYFFRDVDQLEVIRVRLLQPISIGESPRRVRLWSAGCSSGEEVYTLAFLLRDLFPEALGWKLDILGTDIHETSLHRAKAATYRDWSFRNVSPELRSKWFVKSRAGWAVIPEARSHARFKAHNLARDPFEPLSQGEGFDLILCRNVLIYFQHDTKRDIVERFLKALKPGGALVLGHNELGPSEVKDFRVEHFADSLVIRQGEPSVPHFPGRPEHQVTSAPLSVRPTERREPVRPPGGPTPSDPLEGARKAMAGGQHGRALELAKNTRGAESIHVRAHALANMGRGDEAMAMVEDGLLRHPMDVRLHYLHSMLATEQGRHGETLRALDRVLYLDPNHVVALMDRSRIYEEQGRNGEAVGDLSRAIQRLEKLGSDTPVEGLEPFTVEEVRKRCQELHEQYQRRTVG